MMHATSPNDARLRELKLTAYGTAGPDTLAAPGHSIARARLAKLLDPGSWFEIGGLAGSQQPRPGVATPADGCITGFGRIRGLEVALVAEDPAVLAVTDGDVAANKRTRLLKLAARGSLPVVFLADGPAAPPAAAAGGDLIGGGALQVPEPGPRKLPGMVTAVFGPVSGRSAELASTSDVVVATEGCADSHVDQAATSEDVALRLAADAVELLAGPASRGFSPEPERLPDDGQEPGVSEIENLVIDPGPSVHIGASLAAGIGVVLGRVHGRRCMFVLPAPGRPPVDVPQIRRLARAIAICRRRSIPLVVFQDSSGYDTGSLSEIYRLLAPVAEDLAAMAPAKISVIVGAGYADGSFALGGRRIGFDSVLAWPTADVAVRESGAPEAGAGPWLAAGLGIVDDVITPAETRARVASLVEVFARRAALPATDYLDWDDPPD